MFDVFFSGPGSVLGLLGSVGLMLAGYLSKRYIIPFLKVGERERYATYIARIADDITDELRLKYPNRTWLKHLDEAVDSLIDIIDISPDIARRAIKASAARR